MKILAALFLLLPISAFAGVILGSQSYQVIETTQEDGSITEEWKEANKIAPGDKVGYRITYANTGEEEVSGITINNPIPHNTVYVENSARGEGSKITYSIDGSQFSSISELKILENGEIHSAQANDIKHIRWVLETPLAAGAQGNVEFEVWVK